MTIKDRQKRLGDKFCPRQNFLDAASSAEGELPEALLRDMCRQAYALTVAKLPKRLRPEGAS